MGGYGVGGDGVPDLGCIFSGKEKEVSLLEDVDVMDAGGFERELLHLLVDICQPIRYIDYNRQKQTGGYAGLYPA